MVTSPQTHCMPGAVFLEGDRVDLRTVEVEDADVLQRAYNEPAFRGGFLIDTPSNRDATEEWIERATEADDSVYLIVCVDGEVVGCVSLRDIRQDHAMLAYWSLPEHRGNGYVVEAATVLLEHAFDAMGLHRVFAWAVATNEASKAVLDRLGFTHEGTYREHVYVDGDYRDTEHFGLLADEWRETRSRETA